MRNLNRIALILFVAGSATFCSDEPLSPADDIRLEVGFLENDVLVDSLVIGPESYGKTIHLTLAVENRGANSFRYEGNTITTFKVSTSPLGMREEFRGFELLPFERKNIGTIGVSVVDPPSRGARYTLSVTLDDSDPKITATAVIIAN